MSQLSVKQEEFNQLPRPYKQRRYAKSKILREATAFKELPSILMPTADRRIPLPPVIHYGFPLDFDRMNELLERKLNFPPNALEIDPFYTPIHLQNVFRYGIQFKSVYLHGTDSMLFIAVCSNWEPSQSKRLDEIIKELKEFLEVDEDPVWCLDSEEYYWRK